MTINDTMRQIITTTTKTQLRNTQSSTTTITISKQLQEGLETARVSGLRCVYILCVCIYIYIEREREGDR